MHQRLSLDDCLRFAKPENDFYQRLGLGRAANDDAIRNRYRNIACLLHPDVNHGVRQEQHIQALKLVNEAYETLKDKDKKSDYDRQFNSHKNAGQHSPGRSSAQTDGAQSHNNRADSTEDSFRSAGAGSNSTSYQRQWHSDRDSVRDAILVEARKLFIQYPSAWGARKFADLAQRAVQLGAISRRDFKNDQELQQVIVNAAKAIWTIESLEIFFRSNAGLFRVAQSSYQSFKNALKDSNAVDVSKIDENPEFQQHLKKIGQQIWRLHLEYSPEGEPKLTDACYRDFLIAVSQCDIRLSEDPEVRNLIVEATRRFARSIWSKYLPSPDWRHVSFTYRCFLHHWCSYSGVPEESINHACRDLASQMAIRLLDDVSWDKALESYTYFMGDCEASGVLTRKQMKNHPEIKIRVQRMRASIANSHSRGDIEGLLSQFDTACRAAGL